MANFFSTAPLAEAAVEAFRPGKRARRARVAVSGRVFEVPAAERELLTDLPFVDFFEPSATAGDALSLRRLAAVSLASVEADAFRQNPQPRGAPWIAWGRFPTWNDYAAVVRGRESRAFALGTRKQRRLEKQLGPLRHAVSTEDPAVLEQCLAWKRAQYRASGYADVLARPAVRRFFHALRERGVLTISALYAGDTLVAAHVGVRHDGRFYSWVPAYDPEHASSSPGLMLFEHLLEHSHASGDRELDFLLGLEPYKFWYATNVRVVDALGELTMRERLWRAARPRLLGWVRPITPVYESLRSLKRRAVERGVV